MNRIVFAVIFALGLATVAWVGWGFVGSSVLALAMTVLIAGVYLVGVAEIRQFRAATASLRAALEGLAETPAPLADWLARLHPGLQNAVRLRIEGERVALPGPALTPYLVGLLVMLGMLGTFLGMVVTFKGAVFALEGSSDLQAIRSALAAPIKGLGLSFGTSVAGVAASAMLGLLSAISRRERLEAVRWLDQRCATVLRPFSRAHLRQQTFEALQQQATVWPALATQLQAVSEQIEQRHEQLSEQLKLQQQQFHQEAGQAYGALARDVGQALKDSLVASAQAAGDTLRPVVESAMSRLSEASERQHERLVALAEQQVEGLTSGFSATGRDLAAGWNAALQAQARGQEVLISQLDHTVQSWASTFEQGAARLLATVAEAAEQSRSALAQLDAQRQTAWSEALVGLSADLRRAWQQAAEQQQAQQQAVCQTLEKTALEISSQSALQARQTLDDMARLVSQAEALQNARLQDEAAHREAQAAADQQRLSAWSQSLEQAAARLRADWLQMGAQTLAQQQALSQSLEASTREISERSAEQAGRTLQAMGRLAAQSEQLAQSRLDAEARWLQQQGERIEHLAGTWQQALQALSEQQAVQGQAAVQRLADLQSAVGQQLATLGAALEAPMGRLMQTAAAVPEAAASLIGELRQEMSRLTQRDNQALEEREHLMQRLLALLDGVQQASGQQSAAITSLQQAATQVLDEAGQRFAARLGEQADRSEHFAAHLTSSAIELSSLAEAFHQGVQLFSSSNEKLVEGLQRIEGAITQSTARSDEQMAYYVAQAREVIDLSISAQQGIVEELQQLQRQAALQAEGAAG